MEGSPFGISDQLYSVCMSSENRPPDGDESAAAADGAAMSHLSASKQASAEVGNCFYMQSLPVLGHHGSKALEFKFLGCDLLSYLPLWAIKCGMKITHSLYSFSFRRNIPITSACLDILVQGGRVDCILVCLDHAVKLSVYLVLLCQVVGSFKPSRENPTGLQIRFFSNVCT